MTKTIFSLLFIFCFVLVSAQEKDTLQSKDVPFAIIDVPPIYPGCEELYKGVQKRCLQDQIKKHVAKEFNLAIVDSLDLKPGKKRIHVLFTIDHHGNISDIKARAPHLKLEEEGIRVVKMLPKMVPGRHKGENVGVKYAIPITFNVVDNLDLEKQ